MCGSVVCVVCAVVRCEEGQGGLWPGGWYGAVCVVW